MTREERYKWLAGIVGDVCELDTTRWPLYADKLEGEIHRLDEKNVKLREMLGEFIQDNPCNYHGNYCIEHSEKLPCPHEEAKQLLRNIDGVAGMKFKQTPMVKIECPSMDVNTRWELQEWFKPAGIKTEFYFRFWEEKAMMHPEDGCRMYVSLKDADRVIEWLEEHGVEEIQ